MAAWGTVGPSMSEAAARRLLIDPRLRAAGWTVRPLGAGLRESGAPAALVEYPTDNGPADYVLFADGRPLAVVEAKRPGVGPQGVLTQAERYGRGLAGNPFDYDGVRVPFLYSTTPPTARPSGSATCATR